MDSNFSLYDIKKAKEIARKHGSVILTEMMHNIASLDLVDKGLLLNSLKFGVRTRNQEVDHIQFQYQWYGLFHERGANNVFGKGVTLNAQNWRSDAINQELENLNEDFTEYYASLMIEAVRVDETKMKM